MTVLETPSVGRRSVREVCASSFEGEKMTEALVTDLLEKLNRDLKECRDATVSVVVPNERRAQEVSTQLLEALWRDLQDRIWLTGLPYGYSCEVEAGDAKAASSYLVHMRVRIQPKSRMD